MKKYYNHITRSFMYGIVFSILVMFGCGIYSLINKLYVEGICQIISSIVIIIYTVFIRKNRIRSMKEHLSLLDGNKDVISYDFVRSYPLPMVMLNIDGGISWYNMKFAEKFGENSLYDIQIQAIFPDLIWTDVLKKVNDISVDVRYKGCRYNIVGNVIRQKNAQTQQSKEYSVLLYFIDKNEEDVIQRKYFNEKTDVAIISIDNYDEILQSMEDSNRQQTLAQIDKHINEWVSQSKGVLKKTERDRYIVLFEDQYLDGYIDRKFDVLDAVRTISDDVKLPITISIGIGVGSDINQNEAFSRLAIDLALGRGGDQVVVKDETQYKMYGGKSRDYEKSTRVKTRAFAMAFKDFIVNADKVIFMGHSNADYDSLGSAIGLQRSVRALGKKPYIVLDNSPAIKKLVNDVKAQSVYDGMIIDPDTAMEIITKDTLVVILDTHRAEMLPCPELVTKANKVIIIDHHRRSADFISNVSLLYHEPFASSACEIVTEILQYINGGEQLTEFEAQALYVGILMDTKNFVVKTGVRTFEAASYLRKYGVDTMHIKQHFFSTNKDEYVHKSDIIRETQMFTKDIAIAVCKEVFPNIKVIASQAADEMLNLDKVNAAFVVYTHENGNVGVSGRSSGSINVQYILEKLGGGGHMTVAGAQFKNETLAVVKNKLERSITAYMKDNDIK